MSRYFLLNLLLAAVALSAPARAEVTEAQCRARLSARHAPANFRDIYEKFVSDICTGEPSREPAWQSCILSKIESGSVRPQDAYLAWNGCNPTIRACRAEMSKVASGGAGVRSFLADFCVAQPDASPAEIRCIARRARNPYFMNNKSAMYELCIDEAQPCLTDVISRLGIGERENEKLGLAGKVCHNTATDEEARGCMVDRLRAGGVNTANFSEANLLCQEANRPHVACILEEKARGTFHRADGLLREEIPTLVSACKIPSPEARACASARFREGHSIAASKFLCQFSSDEMRSCLVDFIKGQASFSGTELTETRSTMSEDIEWADKSNGLAKLKTVGAGLCGYSNRADRACMTQSVIFFHVKAKASVESALLLSRDACQSRSTEYAECLGAINAGLPIREINRHLGRTVISVGKICEIPTFEIRACIINRLIDVLNDRLTFNDLIASCQAGFVNSLAGSLAGADQANCMFRR